tara:strand:- start:34890 stop:35111 length:222 start_codon:yes stop_codon:yes gene_type:complete
LARRKGATWYVAIVNGRKEARKITLELPMFIQKKISMIYDNDDRSAGLKEVKVNKKGTITIDLLSEGGAVLYN